MTVLVVSLAPRPHLGPRSAPAAGEAALRPPTEYDYVLSRDGSVVATQGRSAPALMPRADTVVAVIDAADLAWHRIVLPKAPAAKLRAALAGLLEDQLLEDPAELHLAVAPEASAGHDTWVAATHKAWLQAQLAALEGAGLVVERVVPQYEPGDPPRGHFEHDPEADGDREMRVVLARPDGVLVLRPQGSLARHWVVPAHPEHPTADWSAEPAAVAAAEMVLGHRVNVLPRGEAQLIASQSAWNLRQFDLASRTRGMRALRQAWRELGSPAWRPIRWGVACLVVAHLAGLNALAWQQRRALVQKQRAQVQLLQTTFPQVRAVLDAPVQMQRETEQLRARAGKPSDTDLEPMLQAVASAWPEARPVEGLRFEPGLLTVAVSSWTDDDIARLRDALEPAGWRVGHEGTQLTLSRARPGGGS